MKINLGAGKKKIEGYLSCDISPDVNPDKCFDLNGKFPFEDNSVEEIIMNHVLEHLKEPLNVLKEIHRVCKDKAIVKIKVPYFSSESAFSNITHRNFFTWTSFDFLDSEHSCHWQSGIKFKIINKKLKWRKVFKPFELLFNLFPRVYQELFPYIFPAKELQIHLKVVK